MADTNTNTKTNTNTIHKLSLIQTHTQIQPQLQIQTIIWFKIRNVLKNAGSHFERPAPALQMNNQGDQDDHQQRLV